MSLWFGLPDCRPTMTLLRIPQVSYLSSQDEASFFNWLSTIDGVVSVAGRGSELEVQVRSKRLPDRCIRELLAIHFRYGLPMRSLEMFETEKNSDWFRDPKAYWYRHVFR